MLRKLRGQSVARTRLYSQQAMFHGLFGKVGEGGGGGRDLESARKRSRSISLPKNIEMANPPLKGLF
jgi:hypothetical protein